MNHRLGVLFATNAFIWGFLLTYMLLRLLGPPGIVTALTFSVWTGIVADWAVRLRERRSKLA